MDVSFIIPVFNQIELTRACLDSLETTVEDIDYEVIFVNDGSEEATTEALRKLAGGRVRVIENAGNQGYAHSNNRGALEARGKYLVLANNDLVFLPRWLEPMLAAFRKFPDLGLCGNVQLNAKTGEVDHAGAFISLKGTVEHRRKRNRSLFGEPAYSRYHVVTGACCAIRRELYQRLGGFDEAFINGGEDVDLCFRIAQQRMKVVVANKSVIKHHVSATRKGPNLNSERNSRLLQRKWANFLTSLAALQWPDSYLGDVVFASGWRYLDPKLLLAAILRFATLKGGAAPVGLEIASCELERNERHWKALIDGWTDEMIRTEERKKHALPLAEGYDFDGLYANPNVPGVWIRETATLTLPRGSLIASLSIEGTNLEANPNMPEERGVLGLAIRVNRRAMISTNRIETGNFSITFQDPPVSAAESPKIELLLLGVKRSNAFAYLGRIFAKNILLPTKLRHWLGKYRAQNLNKRLCIESISVNGERVFDFSKDPTNPLNTDYALRHANLGINLVGWFKAELGIGESARLAAKALKASGLPYALVPLKVNCLSAQGDDSLDSEFTNNNPHPINVFHIDAPQSGDIDHHHGIKFREGKRNIAYWAWELPDFPDRWLKYFKYFDEIWVPSNFVRDSIAIKSPVPVVTVPHCIEFDIPRIDYRKELALPKDKFLFCFAYDLNSYQERKNPKAVIEAFRKAFADNSLSKDVGLVIKIHSSQNNQSHYRELLNLLEEVPNYHLVDRTLSRAATYGLMKACDCYVSLHRAEGFGLTLAESMYLEKPVISTNWSATTEFINATNGCPVNFQLKRLKRNFGPYDKGQLWADPDTDHAAYYMQKMVKEQTWAKDLGVQAKQTIIDLYSPNRVADIYRKRMRALALW